MAPAFSLASWNAFALDPTMLRSSGVKGRALTLSSGLTPLSALIGDDPGTGGSDDGAGVGRSCIIFGGVADCARVFVSMV